MKIIDKLMKIFGVAIAIMFVAIIAASYKRGLIHIGPLEDEAQEKSYEEMMEENNPELCQDLSNAYQQYINLVAEEIKTANMNNHIYEAFVCYMYLLENGHISLGDKFTFKSVTDEDMPNIGAYVAIGTGDSQNQTANLVDTLKVLGYEPKLVCGELCISGEETGVVNHCLCFVEENHHVYLLDPANKTIFLRNGKVFRSIDKDYLTFIPDLYYDKEKGHYPDNKRVYNDWHNFYDDSWWVQDEIPHIEDKVQQLDGDYGEYENSLLTDIESAIDEYLSLYQEELEDLKISIDESTMEECQEKRLLNEQ